MADMACMTACPVPSCSACSTQSTSSWSNAARTCGPPWPYTTYTSAGLSARAVRITCCSSGCPASGCSTLGRSEFMRLPCPAASMTTESGMTAPRPGAGRVSAFLAKLLDGLQLSNSAQQLGVRLRKFSFVRAGAHKFLGPLLGLLRLGLVEILGARGRVGEHRDSVRLHLERSSAHVEDLLLLPRGLNAHVA